MVKKWLENPRSLPTKLFAFLWRVFVHFFGKNNGLLLSGAVAYNTLLSIIPLFAVILVLLSHIIDSDQLLYIIHTELMLIVPGQADTLVDSLRSFLTQREVISIIGFAVLFFFSSIAFRIFENAISLIFGARMAIDKRHFLISAVLPYAFIGCIGLGLVAITAFTAIVNAIPTEPFVLFGFEFSLDRLTGIALYLLGLFSLTTMFTALYKVMPPIKIKFRRALLGGVIVTFAWEITRYILTWYFSSISLVNVIYGSLATVIIVLLTMEIAAIIILIGAQLVAELEHSSSAEVAWFEDADECIGKSR